MRNRSKILLVMLAAAALLASVVGDASARNFHFSEKNFEFIWNPNLTEKTKLEFRDETGHRIRCDVTLLGSLTENTLRKETGQDQGRINHGNVAECEEGSYVVAGFPWEVRYHSFTGALPNIASITLNVIRARFNGTTPEGRRCELISEIARPVVFILEDFVGGAPQKVITDVNTSIPLAGITCLTPTGQLIGTGLVRNLPTTASITVTLI